MASSKFGIIAMCLLAGIAAGTAYTQSPEMQNHPAVVKGPMDGEDRWLDPASADNLGEGAFIRVKLDRVDVPYTNMMAVTQTIAAGGIPVHLHTYEDELIYVVKGNGFAIAGNDQPEISLETGSLIYIPIGEWHGLKNADPNERMEILLVTTPVRKGWLGDFFREATVLPGHPPLNLSEDEDAPMNNYGMVLPGE
ncbi:MAG: cupin domain-containing protein [Gammaproteobacteria bacterium]|nr:cupin domain-containing protein [Gammaproteobacteria bacterium]